MKRHRIPESHVFPFGYKVRVKKVPFAGAKGIWGEWDDEEQTVWLEQDQTPAQMRYHFLHEFEHAFKDWLKWVAKHVPLDNPDKATEEPDGETSAE